MRFALSTLLLAAVASANTTLTYQGTISFGPSNAGDPFSLTVTLSDNPAAAIALPNYFFDESVSGYVDLYDSFVGTGITGDYTRASVVDYAPFSTVSYDVQSGTPYLQVLLATDFSAPLVFGMNFFGSEITNITLFAYSSELTALSPSGSTYDTFLAGAHGVYAIVPELANNSTISTAAGTYYLSLSSLTIGVSPVPEPSTYGLILGGLALAGVALRRRRTSK